MSKEEMCVQLRKDLENQIDGSMEIAFGTGARWAMCVGLSYKYKINNKISDRLYEQFDFNFDSGVISHISQSLEERRSWFGDIE